MPLLAFVAMLAGQMAAAPCPAVAPPPARLSGWTTTSNRPGIGTRFDIAGAASVAGLSAEERGRGGKGVIVDIAVPRAGVYAIAISDAAWIDVRQGGRTLASTGHDHGPACTGIRKIVRFTLDAGRVELRLSGIKAARIGVLIAAN